MSRGNSLVDLIVVFNIPVRKLNLYEESFSVIMIASSYLSEAAISIMSSEIRIGFAGTGFGKI